MTAKSYRVGVYVDGFNLFFGLKSLGQKRLYWLDIQQLARHLVRPPGKLAYTKYFTALVSAPEDRRKRQLVFVEANEALGLHVIKGRFQQNVAPCCGKVVAQEKKTDVNIAVQLLSDAFQDAFDTAILISADADLVPAVAEVKRLCPTKSVIIACPPDRKSLELQMAAGNAFSIKERHLAASMLPEVVRKPDGYELKRPDRWR